LRRPALRRRGVEDSQQGCTGEKKGGGGEGGGKRRHNDENTGSRFVLASFHLLIHLSSSLPLLSYPPKNSGRRATSVDSSACSRGASFPCTSTSSGPGTDVRRQRRKGRGGVGRMRGGGVGGESGGGRREDYQHKEVKRKKRSRLLFILCPDFFPSHFLWNSCHLIGFRGVNCPFSSFSKTNTRSMRRYIRFFSAGRSCLPDSSTPLC